MTKHPTSEAMFEVVRVLERVARPTRRYGTVELDMDEAFVGTDHHPCGSPVCFAGGYLMGLYWDRKSKTLDSEKNIPLQKHVAYLHSSGRGIEYNAGTEEMAKALGFTGERELRDWAFDNPDIWGTSHGHKMFFSEKAFRCREGYPSLTLECIIEQLKQVATALEIMELGSQQ